MSRKKQTYRVIPGAGDPCPRCHCPTQIREHVAVTPKHLAQPYYFSRWFFCTRSSCPTTLIMVDRFKVKCGDQAETSAPPPAPSTGAGLTRRELRFLKVIYPEGTVCKGLTVGRDLHRKRMVRLEGERYALTDLGREACREAFRR